MALAPLETWGGVKSSLRQGRQMPSTKPRGGHLRGVKVERQKGPIPPDVVAKGIGAAGRNARRLMDDAFLLLKHRRYPSACALSILAAEEIEKQSRLFKIAAAARSRARDDLWAGWRDHAPKLAGSLAMLLGGKLPRDRFIRGLPGGAARLKERCLYVEPLRDGTVSAPVSVIGGELGEAVVHAAFFVVLIHGQRFTIALRKLRDDSQAVQGLSPQATRILGWLRKRRYRRELDLELLRMWRWGPPTTRYLPWTRRRILSDQVSADPLARRLA
jgi:AbiV family abortive infection protein